MKNLTDLTVLIVTYKTNKKILSNCIKSIDKNVKVLIVENSKNFQHVKICSKFKNVKFICSGENLGYAKGNNFGLKNIKTKYAFILNPDVLCEKSLFQNISHLIKKKLNFHIIGCQYLRDKVFMPAGYFNKNENNNFKNRFKNKNLEYLTKVEWVTGCSMLINLSKFKNKNIFDKNYFLFFEEFDLCKNIIKKGGSIFTCNKFKIHHLGFKSSLGNSSKEKRNANIVREWHWMWSSFYFYKKHYGYPYSLCKFIGKFIKSFIKMIFYSLTFNSELKDKYKYRFLGLYNSSLNRPSFFRK
tara:strand:+ start:59 stop:955 length:897 start_codon:yes stop_codon:yes gene_type:complete